ncbi:hypothetical protein [Chryseolinea sp. H1M3-3]|uniref:hypothetical protein n=1 Tax=Chryseolinea sp. H1M3-3 TaxID=3034144 RepID=UPI0023EB330A|nr:hypothetical protein [Chryseolinea sp. H1M3-3]
MITSHSAIGCILTAILVVCCVPKDQQIIYREPSSIRQSKSRLDSMYKDSLMVFFEQGFNGTLVEIKRQDKVIYQEKFTTAQEIQLATVKNLGYNKEVREFSVRINNGNEVPIDRKHLLNMLQSITSMILYILTS